MLHALLLTGLLLGDSPGIPQPSSKTIQHPCCLVRLGMTKAEVAMRIREKPITLSLTSRNIEYEYEFFVRSRVRVRYAHGTVQSIEQLPLSKESR